MTTDDQPTAPPAAPPAVPVAPVAADVPADEPVAPAPVAPFADRFATPVAPPPPEPDPEPDPVTVPVTPELASAVPAPPTGTEHLYEPQPAVRRRPGLLAFLPLVLLLLLLAGAAVAWFGPVKEWREAARLDDVRNEALAQSRQLALNIGTIDHAKLDDDLRRISESTTDDARKEFDEKILENEAYKKLVRDNQASLTASIQRIGLVPCGEDDKACLRGETVTVLVFQDQESKNKLRPTPRIDHNRVALTLVRNGGRWLISDVAVL